MYAPLLCLVPTVGVRSPGTVVIGGCESPHGYWGFNSGILKEQSVRS